MDSTDRQTFFSEMSEWLSSQTLVRDILIIVTAMLVAYWVSKFLAKGMIKIAQVIALRSDEESNDARALKLRQTETYLSIATADT